MDHQSKSSELIQRVRDGDHVAAAELVQQYEPLVRREVRMRLRNSALRRLFDSLDICQSVFGSFFLRASFGEYDLDDPRSLVNLLVTMARNKLASASRHYQRQRRDGRRNRSVTDDLDRFPGRVPGPVDVVMAGESLARVRAALSSEEIQIADLRGVGVAWEEIARQLGGTAHARRMQFSRAIGRAAAQLGPENSDV